ncbi:UDP-glycosyltransferase UGT5 [Bemisia tabaci]
MPLKRNKRLHMISISIISILVLNVGTGAFKILVIYPTPSFSHQRSIMALTERLVNDGHELFVVSPNEVQGLKQHGNYTHIDVSFAYEYVKDANKDGDITPHLKATKWDIPKMWVFYAKFTGEEFKSEIFLRFKRRVETEKLKFDVVIAETFLMPFTCGLSRLLAGSAPIISMTTLPVDFSEDPLGSITHLSFVPFIFSDYTDKMTLWQRLENWISQLYIMRACRSTMEEAARRFFRETFGPGKESLVDGCWSNVSLSIITSNSLYYYPRLLGPNIVEAGPLHLKPPEKLPQNLQDWLDGAQKGVIFFSLGSNMKSSNLPKEAKENFLNVFSQLPAGYRVLWKWELDGKIPGQTENILTQKWVPQDSVLAHPKVKLFVTQGGHQSFQETVHYGVPTVGIPWYGDQECIVSKMVDTGTGARLPPYDLFSYEKVKAAIEAVLFDDSFSKNMKRLSAISKDFSSQAMDKAVFWVEHVARVGGASHLRPATADATFFQYFCLDIISVILASSILVLFVFHKLCRILISLTARSEPASKLKKID